MRRSGTAEVFKVVAVGAQIPLSTLAAIVEALGAALSIRARFPDGTERELDLGSRRRRESRRASAAGVVGPHEIPAEPTRECYGDLKAKGEAYAAEVAKREAGKR